MLDYLFLYGTLLPDLTPRKLKATVQSLRWVRSGSVRGFLYDLGRYPGAVLDECCSGNIIGEVYELADDPDLLARLDTYEGVDPRHPDRSLFLRRQCIATLTDGESLECWIYVYNRPTNKVQLIPHGDYRKWKSGQAIQM